MKRWQFSKNIKRKREMTTQTPKKRMGQVERIIGSKVPRWKHVYSLEGRPWYCVVKLPRFSLRSKQTKLSDDRWTEAGLRKIMEVCISCCWGDKRACVMCAKDFSSIDDWRTEFGLHGFPPAMLSFHSPVLRAMKTRRWLYPKKAQHSKKLLRIIPVIDSGAGK